MALRHLLLVEPFLRRPGALENVLADKGKHSFWEASENVPADRGKLAMVTGDGMPLIMSDRIRGTFYMPGDPSPHELG